MRIAICTPYYKQLPAKTCTSLIKLVYNLTRAGIESGHIFSDYTYVDEARQLIWERFKKEHDKKPFDWIMHIDSDQTFFPNQVKQLISDATANNFPILSGIYFGRTEAQVTPVLMRKLDDETRARMAEAREKKIEELRGPYYRIANIPAEQFFEVDVAGLGFLACKPKVYEDIVEKTGPYIFDLVRMKDGSKRRDDVLWCEKARKCGYKIMVDRRIMVGHMGGEVLFRDFKAWCAERWLASNKRNEAFHKEE